MNRKLTKAALCVVGLAVGCTLAPNGFAVHPKKWEEVPKAVRTTILK